MIRRRRRTAQGIKGAAISRPERISIRQTGECAQGLHEMRFLFTSMIEQWDHEVLVVDAKGTIINVNSRLVASWGGSHDEYLGKNCFDMGNPELYGQNRRMFFEAALESGGAISENFTCTTEEGQVRHYTINAFPLRDAKNDIRRMILTRKDVTEQTRLEKRLRESLKMAAMGELATYAAHEIRNPLFAIGGFAQQLLREPLADSAKEKLQIIIEEAHRLESICDNITSFAKPADLNMGDVDVNLIAERTLEVMGFDCEERNISLRANLARDIPKVHANAGMLQQALVNIVKNAKEAVQSGGLICVHTRYADAVVYLEVEDDGSGIPLEMQDRIFNPFFSTKEQGNGLGLALTKKMLQEMDGAIYLHSRPGNTLISIALRPLFADSDIRAGRSEIARAEVLNSPA